MKVRERFAAVMQAVERETDVRKAVHVLMQNVNQLLAEALHEDRAKIGMRDPYKNYEALTAVRDHLAQHTAKVADAVVANTQPAPKSEEPTNGGQGSTGSDEAGVAEHSRTQQEASVRGDTGGEDVQTG